MTDLRDAVTTAVPVVRGLEWANSEYNRGVFWAHTKIGDFQCDYYEGDGGAGWVAYFGDTLEIGHFAFLHEAKAAAQADYEQRILSAINPDFLSELDTARAEIERLTKALKPFADTFRQHNDPGVSDLYNEQPVAWHVPLGAYRVAATLSPAVKDPK